MTTARRYASGLLSRAVQSVLGQSFSDFEFIICDDASTDGTAAYLAEVAASDDRVKVIRNPRNVNSVAISLGRCMRAASPSRRWVSWMFDDCVLLPNALSELVKAASRRDTKVTYGVTDVAQRDGGTLRVGDMPYLEMRTKIHKSSCLVPNGGMLIESDVFDEIGWYDSSIVLRRSCDWDLFVRMIDAGIEFQVLPTTLMQEDGELQPDSLRRSFTTDLGLMSRYMQARNEAGLNLSLGNVLVMPTHWIPPSPWSHSDLQFMRFMFLEYYLSTANVFHALRWARMLVSDLPRSDLMRDMLLVEYDDKRPRGALAAAAYAGEVLNAYRQKLDQSRLN